MSKEGDRIYAERMRFFRKTLVDMRDSGKVHMVTEPQHPDALAHLPFVFPPRRYVPDFSHPTIRVSDETVSYLDPATGEVLETVPRVKPQPERPTLRLVTDPKTGRDPK
jgi:hypothetical protein